MSKIIAHILVGIVAAALLKIASVYFVPTSIQEMTEFDAVVSLCCIACVIISCAIYYIKAPPGKDNRG